MLARSARNSRSSSPCKLWMLACRSWLGGCGICDDIGDFKHRYRHLDNACEKFVDGLIDLSKGRLLRRGAQHDGSFVQIGGCSRVRTRARLAGSRLRRPQPTTCGSCSRLPRSLTDSGVFKVEVATPKVPA